MRLRRGTSGSGRAEEYGAGWRGPGSDARVTSTLAPNGVIGAGADDRRITIRLGVPRAAQRRSVRRSEEHTSELQSHSDLVCRLLLEKKKKKQTETEQYMTRHRT